MAALLAALSIFLTGIVLLTRFHVGSGSLRVHGAGLSRFAWVTMHRLSAVVMVATVAIHAALHWNTIILRISRAWRGVLGKGHRANLWLYYAFLVVAATGFAAWFVVPGSPPLWSSFEPTPLPLPRHFVIDLHHASGLALLAAVTIHVRRHLSWIVRHTSAWQKPT